MLHNEEATCVAGRVLDLAWCLNAVACVAMHGESKVHASSMLQNRLLNRQ